MRQEELKSLLARYHKGEATEEDLIFLESWYIWRQQDDTPSEIYTERELLEDAGTVWNRLNGSRSFRLRRIIAYAAAVCLLVSIGLWRMDIGHRSEDLDMTHIVAPTDHEATITLADGRIIPLSNAQSSIRMGEGDIIYSDGTSAAEISLQEIPQDLVISVPSGRTYQLTLSDSTNVWLNAGSSLRYPSRFDDTNRRVVLEGEAYFEVHPKYHNNHKRSKQQFIVETSAQSVDVLGTHFNVRAYPSEQQRTTLIEGKIQLAVANSKRFTVLNPGQEATIASDGVKVKEVNTDMVSSWRYGLFVFDDKSFDEIMQEVSVWFDLDIVYEGSIPRATFFGQAYRTDNLKTVLRLLESAGIEYRVTSAKQLIITNKS